MNQSMTTQQEAWLRALHADVEEMCNALRITSKAEKQRELMLEEQLQQRALEQKEDAQAAALAARHNRQACKKLQQEITAFATLHKDYVRNLVQHFSAESEKCQQMVWNAINSVLLSEVEQRQKDEQEMAYMMEEERERYEQKKREQQREQEVKLEQFAENILELVISAANRTAQWMQEAASERQQLLHFLQQQAAKEKSRQAQDEDRRRLDKEQMVAEREKALLKTLNLVRKELTSSHNSFEKETLEMARRKEKEEQKKGKVEKDEEAHWRKLVQSTEETARQLTRAAVEAKQREKKKQRERQGMQTEEERKHLKTLAKLAEQVRQLEKEAALESTECGSPKTEDVFPTSASGSYTRMPPSRSAASRNSALREAERERRRRKRLEEEKRMAKAVEDEEERRREKEKKEKEEMALFRAIETTQEALELLRQQQDGSKKDVEKAMNRHASTLKDMVQAHTLKMKELRDVVLPKAKAELEHLERNRDAVLQGSRSSVKMLIEDKQQHIRRMNDLVRRMKVAIEGTKEKILEVEEAEEAALEEEEAERDAAQHRLRRRDEMMAKENAAIMARVQYHTQLSSALEEAAAKSQSEREAELLQWQEECARLQNRLRDVSRKRVHAKTEAQRRLDRLAMEAGVCKADFRSHTEPSDSIAPSRLHRQVRDYAAARGMGEELRRLDTVLDQMNHESHVQPRKKAEEEIRRQHDEVERRRRSSALLQQLLRPTPGVSRQQWNLSRIPAMPSSPLSPSSPSLSASPTYLSRPGGFESTSVYPSRPKLSPLSPLVNRPPVGPMGSPTWSTPTPVTTSQLFGYPLQYSCDSPLYVRGSGYARASPLHAGRRRHRLESNNSSSIDSNGEGPRVRSSSSRPVAKGGTKKKKLLYASGNSVSKAGGVRRHPARERGSSASETSVRRSHHKRTMEKKKKVKYLAL